MPDTMMTVYAGATAPADNDAPHLIEATGKKGGEGGIYSFCFGPNKDTVAKIYYPDKVTEQAQHKAESMAEIWGPVWFVGRLLSGFSCLGGEGRFVFYG